LKKIERKVRMKQNKKERNSFQDWFELNLSRDLTDCSRKHKKSQKERQSRVQPSLSFLIKEEERESSSGYVRKETRETKQSTQDREKRSNKCS